MTSIISGGDELIYVYYMKYLVPAYLVLLFFSCKNKTESTYPIIQNITESVYAPGIVKSKDQYQVYASANGIIRHIHDAIWRDEEIGAGTRRRNRGDQ